MKVFEEDLINKIKQGDKDAFVFIYRNFYKKLCASAYRFVKNVDISEEIVQHVIFKIWERKAKLNFPENIENYLYKAVHNETLNYLKKIKLDNQVKQNLSAGLIQQEQQFFDPLHTKELQLRISEAIGNLPEKSKEVFIMNRNQGLSYKEIADHLVISVKGVEFHMIKALKLLKEELKEYMYFLI